MQEVFLEIFQCHSSLSADLCSSATLRFATGFIMYHIYRFEGNTQFIPNNNSFTLPANDEEIHRQYIVQQTKRDRKSAPSCLTILTTQRFNPLSKDCRAWFWQKIAACAISWLPVLFWLADDGLWLSACYSLQCRPLRIWMAPYRFQIHC